MKQKNVRLTKREAEITELLAWGASKKEVADILFISERTVENHARNIYEKTGCGKVNELSAWWFCFHFRIPHNMSPLVRRIGAVILLCIYLSGSIHHLADHRRIRISNRAVARIERVIYNRRIEAA